MMETAKQLYCGLCHAYELLENTTDSQTFQVLWIASLSVCRSIGYVLGRDEDETVRKTSRELFKEWRSDGDCIFNVFIDFERNMITHEGKLGCSLAPHFAVVVSDDAVTSCNLSEDLVYVPFSADLHDRYGDVDVRDLLRDAISWWGVQLRRIETKLLNESESNLS